MNYKKLEQNIIDMLEEQQIKLGFLRETVRLYYPLSSLNHYCEVPCNAKQMEDALHEFATFTSDRLGTLEISHKKDRFCIGISPDGAQYVHDHMEDTSFLKSFIDMISQHDCRIEQLIELFEASGERVRIFHLDEEDFDYMLCFENGIPDTYRYCIKSEGCHLTYHRFTPEDYRDLGFQT